MSQHDFNIANQTSGNARTDINNALVALATLSSGATAPATTFANMLWYDTANDALKLRNEADSGWIVVAYINQSTAKLELADNTSIVSAVGTQTGLLGGQSTATWEAGTGTTESLVSPANVKAAIDALVTDTIGIGQTWQSVSRSANVSYQNITGMPIQAMVQLGQNASYTFQVSPDNATWLTLFSGDGGAPIVAAAIIPNSYYYRATGGITRWAELR